MEVVGSVEHPAGGICLAVLAGVAGHVVLVDIVPAAVAHIAVSAVAPLRSMAGPGIVYLTACLVSFCSPVQQELSLRHYAEVAGLV